MQITNLKDSAESRYDFLSGTLLQCKWSDTHGLMIVVDGDTDTKYSLVILLLWRYSEHEPRSFLIRSLSLRSYAMARLESVLYET
jgi:hypothetical protein